MARTTIRIDDPVLRDLKRLQRQERKPLGELVSELLAEAMSRRGTGGRVSEPPLQWVARPMGFTIDLEDREAVQTLLDREQFPEFFR